LKTGRPRKPTALHLLEGTSHPGRLPKNEPKPRPVRPACPRFLNRGARNIWNNLVKELESMGVLTAVDASVLAGYCGAYEEAMRLSRYVDRYGFTVTTPSGYLQQRPEVSIRNKAWDRVAKFGSELGIGAASRSRIEVKKPDDAVNPLQEIIEASRAEAAARRS
jgi:P27 family predicted phage terminase small subunit